VWRSGLLLVVLFVSFVVCANRDAPQCRRKKTLTLIGNLVWNGILAAFCVVSAVVSYHDLAVAKEGTNTRMRLMHLIQEVAAHMRLQADHPSCCLIDTERLQLAVER
jgi:hypothetical protein